MPLLHLILVALIQGITEFLPVSSSGHLILLPSLTGMEDQGVVIDVAVHLGTLVAVVLFFRRDVAVAVKGIAPLMAGDRSDPGARLALNLAIATVPATLFGAFLGLTGLIDMLRSIAVIGWTMLGFGLVLWWADRTGPTAREAQDWTLRHAVIMGIWQALALIPGTSRSGITITGARVLGYGREDAARIAMLMSIPIILATGLYAATDIAVTANVGLLRDAAIAALLACIAALGALTLMMRLLRSVSFTPYVIYRVILGAILLWIAYS